MPARSSLLAACLALSVATAQADVSFVRGKVILENGTPPGVSVLVEKVCYGLPPSMVAIATPKGDFNWHIDLDPFGPSVVASCVLRASLKGYTSSEIDLSQPRLAANPQLPNLILTPRTNEPVLKIDDIAVPRAAAKPWALAVKALQDKKWPEAERQLRLAVAAAPRFAHAWTALGMTCENQQRRDEARDAYEHAVAADPKALLAHLLLARLQLDAKDWPAAAKTVDALTTLDTRHRYPEILLDRAIVLYHLKDFDGAEASANESIRLDKRHERPRAEYVLGLILEARHDYAGAAEHIRKYLELDPRAPDIATARTRLENLGKPDAPDPAPEIDSLVPGISVGDEAWVPGGFKAFAAMAGLQPVPTYADLFLEYCRALAWQSSPLNPTRLPTYSANMETYINTLAELTQLGEQQAESTRITLSLVDDPRRKFTERVLGLLGWKVSDEKDGTIIEPSDRPADGVRQQIPSALGIDEVAMQRELGQHRDFQFEIPTESARFAGGSAWNDLLKGIPPAPGGMAAVFARDRRLARVYAGLGAMSPEAAAAVIKGVGMRPLMAQHANLLELYAGTFSVVKGTVVLPGGPDAHAAWQRLAGASPFDPPSFFRSILDRDHGNLAAFYAALARADAAHQRFFTQSSARMERFYTWYRDSGQVNAGMDRVVGAWRRVVFSKLPLDAAGHVRFPGGKAAWNGKAEAGDDSLFTLDSLEALVPVAELEEKRNSPLDEGSAAILSERYASWRYIFPYFESLPGFGRAEFRALEQFADTVAPMRPAVRAAIIGEWHSLVELIVLGTRSGALDPVRSAAAFRHACEGLAAPDHTAKALQVLSEIAEGPDLTEAVATNLLRLTGPRRTAFDRVMELQQVPRLTTSGSTQAALVGTALAGLVYAAVLDPDHLLVSEDPHLLTKHRFLDLETTSLALFQETVLRASSDSPGSHLVGGFATIDQLTRNLSRRGKSSATATPSASHEPSAGPAAEGQPAPGPSLEPATLFRANGRLVEVHTTVTDDRGRYVDDLASDAFTVLEEGKPVATVAFENRTSPVSVALLFDTTGSMEAALPALRNAALRLIGELRPTDSFAVYSFNETVTELQPFTTDKDAAKRAVLRTRAQGATALYDALVRVNLDLAERGGKKVIVVFTDGADNASTLTTDAAILKAKSAGIPIYTIAQGEALQSPALLKQLSVVSRTTGGVAFAIHGPSEIREVFETVAQDLMHGYLLTFRPSPLESHAWRTLEVVLQSPKNRKVRSREGYYPD